MVSPTCPHWSPISCVLPSPGRSVPSRAEVCVGSRRVRLVQALSSFPPLRWSCSVSVDPPLFFSLALSGFARSGPGVLCWCSLLLLRSPLRVLVKYLFISSSWPSHLHFPFILIFTSFSVAPPCQRQGVCVTHLHRCKTSIIYIIYIYAGGHRGPGGVGDQ